MDGDLRDPPASKALLTPPDILAKRLSVLLGAPFHLTRRPRTDGSRLRKLITETLQRYPLPPASPKEQYMIVPPKGKGVPTLLREYIDTYIVTTGNSYNLQVWNRNPSQESVLIEYNSGERLNATDVRFVLVRVNPISETIDAILVLSPKYIEAKFGRFGKPTIKYQLIIPGKERERVSTANPPGLFYPDTSRVVQYTSGAYVKPETSIHAPPIPGKLLPISVIQQMCIKTLIGITLNKLQTKNRGQALELLVSQMLGYQASKGELLAGGYPDIRNQALEVKVQDSPTVDLGLMSPQFEENVPSSLDLTTSDIRYLLALTDSHTSRIQGIVLCPGDKLGLHFTYVGNKSYKCQRSISMSFFEQFKGQAVFDP